MCGVLLLLYKRSFACACACASRYCMLTSFVVDLSGGQNGEHDRGQLTYFGYSWSAEVRRFFRGAFVPPIG